MSASGTSSLGPKQRVFAGLAEIAQALGHAHRLEDRDDAD
jgi:hypothetical protein